MKAFEQVFQGDIWLMRLPDEMVVEKEQEIHPALNKLILQEGEMTGHHHHIDLLERVEEAPKKPKVADNTDYSDSWRQGFKDPALRKAFKDRARSKLRLFKASKLSARLVANKVLLRPDLVVGYLEAEDGAFKVLHQEHNSVYLPKGKYIIGRQIESVSGEERKVAD